MPAGLGEDLAAQGIRYAAVSFVDLHGKPKAKMVPVGHLGRAAAGSELFTGAALDGVPQEVNDDEVSARPDLAGGTVLPWRPDVIWYPSELWLRDEPFAACSRHILHRVTDAAAALGWRCQLGIETEFFLLRDGAGGPTPADAGDTLDKPCYDLRSLLRTLGPVDRIVSAMDQLGWGVYSFDHEDGNGQFETDFGYTDALRMADRFVFFRMMVGELAAADGLLATWMPKPFADRTGSGAHLNVSLASLESGDNLFADAGDPRGCGLGRLGYPFIAGVLRHAAAICALVAPTVNSYKRLVKQGSMSGLTWAPVLACYGNNNRTNMLRVPMGGGRVECRAADSANNPYLAAALLFAAGLEGIAEGLDPGPPSTGNLYALGEADLAERGISRLPRTLLEAVEALEADQLARSVLGPAMHRSFVAAKRAEWDEYHATVSAWEHDRYLRFF